MNVCNEETHPVLGQMNIGVLENSGARIEELAADQARDGLGLDTKDVTKTGREVVPSLGRL